MMTCTRSNLRTTRMCSIPPTLEAESSDQIAEYDMELLDIDSDQLWIPDTEYCVLVSVDQAYAFCRNLSPRGVQGGVRFARESMHIFYPNGLKLHEGNARTTDDEEDDGDEFTANSDDSKNSSGNGRTVRKA
ncbi:hypothetical protein BD410DRAFT_52325 [Rickenella mellea]|uniref:Uncharacterized protein n=1 Tax=Rickenella mellea TaxID=50990 RepID=A0A4R5XI02_9AGAM|nr:hypothetical protein BD410DRAFT_52325 [Rickenella mellea]